MEKYYQSKSIVYLLRGSLRPEHVTFVTCYSAQVSKSRIRRVDQAPRVSRFGASPIKNARCWYLRTGSLAELPTTTVESGILAREVLD